MIETFATLLPTSQLIAKDLYTGPVPTRGRNVPPDRIAEPEFRPLYPRYVKRSKALPAPNSQLRRDLATEAAHYRTRVAVEACKRREAMLAARHPSALIGGAA